VSRTHRVERMRRERSSQPIPFEDEMSRGLRAWMRSTIERSVHEIAELSASRMNKDSIVESTHESDRNEKSNMSGESPARTTVEPSQLSIWLVSITNSPTTLFQAFCHSPMSYQVLINGLTQNCRIRRTRNRHRRYLSGSQRLQHHSTCELTV